MGAGAGGPADQGLPSLRRGGTLAELLFLYDCVAVESTRLRPIARRLGVSVQAVSHTYRQLARRGLAEVREGRYHPTVTGVAWLHRTLGGLAEDVFQRQQKLHIIRSCRAVATAPLRANEVVSLRLIDGVLSAVPGRSGSSRGRAANPARTGDLLEVRDLEGILTLRPAEIHVITISPAMLDDARLTARIRAVLGATDPDLVAAHGLEAFHAVRRAHAGPIVRFAAGPACREAALVGVRTILFVLDVELPRLLAQFPGPEAPRLLVRPLDVVPRRRVPKGRGRRPEPAA